MIAQTTRWTFHAVIYALVEACHWAEKSNAMRHDGRQAEYQELCRRLTDAEHYARLLHL